MISGELREFIRSGLSVCIGSRDGSLSPNGTRAWGALADDDGTHLDVYVPEQTAGALLRDLEAYPQVALLLDRASLHRARQLKGTFAGSRPCREDERSEVERQIDLFLEDLARIGVPRELAAGWSFWPCVVVRMRVLEIFEQSPGPGTGERMRG